MRAGVIPDVKIELRRDVVLNALLHPACSVLIEEVPTPVSWRRTRIIPAHANRSGPHLHPRLYRLNGCIGIAHKHVDVFAAPFGEGVSGIRPHRPALLVNAKAHLLIAHIVEVDAVDVVVLNDLLDVTDQPLACFRVRRVDPEIARVLRHPNVIAGHPVRISKTHMERLGAFADLRVRIPHLVHIEPRVYFHAAGVRLVDDVCQRIPPRILARCAGNKVAPRHPLTRIRRRAMEEYLEENGVEASLS